MRSSEPVRSPIAATWRESTSAVSRTDSPAGQLHLVRAQDAARGRRARRCRPRRRRGCGSRAARRRSATERPASAREASGSAFSSCARSSRAVECGRVELGAGEEVLGQAAECTVRPAVRVLTWNLYHGRAVPPAGRALLGCVRGRAGELGVGRRAAPGGPAVVARPARGVRRRRRAARADLAQPRPSAAPRDRGPRPGPAGRQRRRRERDPRARERSASTAPCCCAGCPSAGCAHGVRLADGTWVVNVHAHNTPPERALADCERARAAALGWAAGAPLVLGGDLNLRRPVLAGLRHVAGNHVDHILAARARRARAGPRPRPPERPSTGRRDARAD